MIFGMTAFTLFHVALSLVGIGSGFVVAYGYLASRRLEMWNAIFLLTTVATSATGFLFPFEKLLPSHVVGVISLIVLAVAIYAKYVRRLSGGWQRVYVISALASQYFNVFVLVVQLFLKVPGLKALAPTQSELPFAIAQGIVLFAFITLGFIATIKSRRVAISAA